MAFTKKYKSALVEQYREWLNKSKAVFLLEYGKMTQKDIDTLRAKAREADGELHVVKNTLFTRVMDEQGIETGKLLENTSLAGFAFGEAPALAKVVSDGTNRSEIFKIKGAFLGKEAMNPAQVKALADLPPLPVLRAQLLGVIQAPASKLVRTFAEPGRGLAAVIKAHSEAAG